MSFQVRNLRRLPEDEGGHLVADVVSGDERHEVHNRHGSWMVDGDEPGYLRDVKRAVAEKLCKKARKLARQEAAAA